jgi:hypothetical protein
VNYINNSLRRGDNIVKRWKGFTNEIAFINVHTYDVHIFNSLSSRRSVHNRTGDARMIKLILFTSLGVIAGQFSIFYAYNPVGLYESSLQLAQASYVAGCQRAASKGTIDKCVKRSYDFIKEIRDEQTRS